MSRPLNLEDYESAAAQVLDPMTLGYFVSGSDDQLSRDHNREAWQRLRLRPRSFVDVSRIRMDTTVLGQSISMP